MTDAVDVGVVDELTDVADLDDIDALDDLDSETLPDADDLDLDQLGPLVEGAKSLLESVTEGKEDPSAGKLQALLHLVNLIQGVLKTTDADELLKTVDFDEIDSVVDLDSIGEAVESGDISDAVELTNLRKLVEFGQLWQTIDLSELVSSKDEITETVGQLTGDDDGEGGLFDGIEMDDLTGDGEMAQGLTDPEMMQAATQAQLDDAIDGFRDLLVETHVRLDQLREANKQRFDGVDQPTSRNPTAVSTLSTHSGPPKAGSAVSTVPRNVRHSTGPSRRRIYGRRFEKLVAEKRDDEETDAESDAAGVDADQEVDADEGGDDK